MNIKTSIKKKVRLFHNDFVQIRRHIHSHPELSFKEKETNAFLVEKLKENNINFKSGYCKYGIVAEIKGKKKGKGITYLRGDMDALPIQEENKVSYKSRIDGVMHACGHDVHSTCVLGSAIVLNELKDQFAGTVRFLFQPGEEQLPGGASIMIKDGAIKNAKSATILGQHVHPPLEVGKVGFHKGQYMASADEIFIEVIGKGGHAALPNDCIDTILVASQIISQLHTIVSRYADPKIPTVLSFGKINSDGGATNIIPDKVHIRGTLRTMDEKNRKHVSEIIKSMTKSIAKAYGARAKVLIKYGYPCLFNDHILTDQMMEAATQYLGKENVVYLEKRMTAEDFSYYSQMMPACFYRLGTGNKKKKINSPVHTSTFNIDEEALQVGVGLMSYGALKVLGN